MNPADLVLPPYASHEVCRVCNLEYGQHPEFFGLEVRFGVNNCAQKNGGSPSDCPMCSGACITPHTFLPTGDLVYRGTFPEGSMSAGITVPQAGEVLYCASNRGTGGPPRNPPIPWTDLPWGEQARWTTLAAFVCDLLLYHRTPRNSL